jgi:hypothetical protein
MRSSDKNSACGKNKAKQVAKGARYKIGHAHNKYISEQSKKIVRARKRAKKQST